MGRVLTLNDRGELRFREARANGANEVILRSPAALAGSVTWDLPNADGTPGQLLQTNGAGVLSWASALASPLGIQLTWSAGLGAIVHLLGPTDQNFAVRAPASRSLVVGANNVAMLALSSTGLLVSDGLGAITTLQGPADQPLLIFGGTGRALTLGADGGARLTMATSGALSFATGLGAITHLTGPSDQPLLVHGGTGRALTLGAGAASLVTLTTTPTLEPVTDDTVPLGTTTKRFNGLRVGTGAASFAGLVLKGVTSLQAAVSSVIGSGVFTQQDPSVGAGLGIITVGAHANPGTLAFLKTRSTDGTTSLVGVDDPIVDIAAYGADATQYHTAARIRLSIDGTPSTGTDMPGKIEFWTTPNASATLAKRLTIGSEGNVGIGAAPATTFLVDIESGSSAALRPLTCGGTYSGASHFVFFQNLSGAHSGAGLMVDMAGSGKFIDTTAGAGTAAHLTNAGVWTDASCFREFKVNNEPLDAAEVLDKIALMSIERWNHKTDIDKSIRNPRKYVSCYQDDLVTLFGLGTDGISAREVASIALLGIQALRERLLALEAKVP